MDLPLIFRERFGELLFGSKKTSSELSVELNIHYSIIQKYLRGVILPSLSNTIAIADYFDCSVDYLFGLAAECGQSFKKAISFSIALRKILEKNNCTRYRFQKDTGISRQLVDDWYNGKRIPSIDSVIKVAKYFDCTVDYLLGRE